MKFYVLLIMVCSVATHLMGGNPGTCPNPRRGCNGYGLKGPKTPTNQSIVVSNSAYFNVRPSAIKPELTLRSGTPISISEQNMRNMMAVGRVEHNYVYDPTLSISMNIGMADNMNAQTWTLPNTAPLTTPEVDARYDYIAPASVTPVAAQVAGATHVRKAVFTDLDNEILTFYKHYKMVAGDKLEEMGSTYVDNGVVSDFEEPAQIYADAPLDMGDAFQTSVTTHEDEDEYPKTVAVSDVVVDGFGAITTPFGNTYQCLRLSLTRTQTDYTDAMTSTTGIDYMVAWVTREGFRFYGVKPTQGASGTTMLTGLDMSYFENATLEVELRTFEGRNTEGGNLLTWITASEKNNAGFDVERSTDGRTFEKIGFVKGNGTTNAQQMYNFTDNLSCGYTRPCVSTVVYYRLRQIDIDGSTVTSNVISILPKGDGKALKVYPNPSSDNQITLDLAADTEGVLVINALGQTVFQQKTVGQNNLQVNVSAWAKGVYFIKTAGNTEGVKFVKQ
jgi:hypothetical protein